ncbi:MAG: SAM-dependent methyltransferase [Phycisphaerae bacterium]
MSTYSQAVETARTYYNSDDADTFYFTIWGGEDIHVGLYESRDEPIADASRRTVERMAARLGPDLGKLRLLDLGGGYGGAMRHLAKTTGCRATVLNLSEVENERGRDMNRAQGVDHLVETIDGDFKHVPADDASYDAAWSQDAILHADDRSAVVAEVARVLKPGGSFVFTDPMQADDAPTHKLKPIYDRIHLQSLASPGYYNRVAAQHGLRLVAFEEHAEMIARHYGRVLDELNGRGQEMLSVGISQAYVDNMKRGLRHWIDGGNNGYLTWGIFHFRKA